MLTVECGYCNWKNGRKIFSSCDLSSPDIHWFHKISRELVSLQVKPNRTQPLRTFSFLTSRLFNPFTKSMQPLNTGLSVAGSFSKFPAKAASWGFTCAFSNTSCIRAAMGLLHSSSADELQHCVILFSVIATSCGGIMGCWRHCMGPCRQIFKGNTSSECHLCAGNMHAESVLSTGP